MTEIRASPCFSYSQTQITFGTAIPLLRQRFGNPRVPLPGWASSLYFGYTPQKVIDYYIVHKANKRLYTLSRVLRKSGVHQVDLVSIYCSLTRSVLSYAAPVLAAIPDYVSDLIELLLKKQLVLHIQN